MLAARGLYGHIRNNDLRATALLCLFALYAGLLWIGACLFYVAIGFDLRVVGAQLETGRQLAIPYWLFGLRLATQLAMRSAWVPVVFLAGWLTYAYCNRKQLIRDGTASQPVTRSLEPKLYNAIEGLAIAAGLPMPAVEIIETDALNAYACGWTPADSTVVVTRGLLQRLSKEELEAALAHEITHIRHRDVRLMTVAGVFVGSLLSGGRMLGGGRDGAATRNLALRSSGGAGILFALATFVIATLASGLAVLSRFALSRTREFVADAGAVALTKNPDALIRALRKISEHGVVPAVPDALRAMMIFSLPNHWWTTHPSIERRIAALETYAGGRCTVMEYSQHPAPQAHRSAAPAASAIRSPIPGARPFGRRERTP